MPRSTEYPRLRAAGRWLREWIEAALIWWATLAALALVWTYAPFTP